MKHLTLSLALLASSMSVFAAENAQAPEIVGRSIFGLMNDFQNDPVVRERQAVIHPKADEQHTISRDDRQFSYSSFDHEIGAVFLELHHRRTGQVIDAVAIDSSNVDGVTHPRGGQTTPWNTVLLSEANAVDAANADSFVEGFKPYFKDRAEMVNPYHYGWPLEVVTLDAAGSSKMVKHYAMGRLAATHVLPMPDSRAVYLMDAKNAGFLYLFVADDVESLSDGSLYVATQGSAGIQWLPLADTSALKAKFKLKKIKPSKLFDSKASTSGACSEGFTFIDTVYGQECVQLKDKRYSGLFEPIRAAAVKGAIDTFKGAEDLSFDAENQAITVRWADGQQQRYSLSGNNEMGTQYLIQDSL